MDPVYNSAVAKVDPHRVLTALLLLVLLGLGAFWFTTRTPKAPTPPARTAEPAPRYWLVNTNLRRPDGVRATQLGFHTVPLALGF